MRKTRAVKGRVYLAGAGPGDPELLTMKAVRLLESADVVFHDDLVPDEVLALAHRHALVTVWANVAEGRGLRSKESMLC